MELQPERPSEPQVEAEPHRDLLFTGRPPLAGVGVLALAACGGEDGGGGTGSGAAPAPAAPEATPTLTEVEASRFLAHATNGATRSEIDRLVSVGIDRWFDEQLAMPRGPTHWSRVAAGGFSKERPRADSTSCDNSIWHQAISAPDQLRQRVALALLDILVVGTGDLRVNWREYAVASYMDLLLDHAFGNFRDLLGAVTRNIAMARYLTFLSSRKANGTGSQPDENFARELLQLFTIGLYELDESGSVKVDSGGAPIETYTQGDVSQLARVFTGLQPASTDRSNPDTYRQPLRVNAQLNERGSSTFLGRTVGGGGLAAIDAALDVIFAHPNVPPFVSRNLIQRLTTSNPSPAYVRRVAGVFASSNGRRGDLSAVVRAILTDLEVRNPPPFTKMVTVGKVRDPVQRFTNWARAFDAAPANDEWDIGDLSHPSALGQSPARSPSVFNFFRPGYSPPHTEISKRGLVAPELQIASEQSVVGYVNFMARVVFDGIGGLRPNYGKFEALADDSAALVDEINLVLAAGQVSQDNRKLIRSAVDSIALSDPQGATRRVATAALLTLSAPDYVSLY